MGDGDVIQRLIDFCLDFWKKNNIQSVHLSITGIDLNFSRVENAKNLVKNSDDRITCNFHQGDFVTEKLKYKEKYFDYSLVCGVFEILDDIQFSNALKEISRVTNKGIYIEDVYEKFPGGHPRDTLGKSLLENGFKTQKRHVILTEPFNKNELQDPRKLWPNLLDQNIWAAKV